MSKLFAKTNPRVRHHTFFVDFPRQPNKRVEVSIWRRLSVGQNIVSMARLSVGQNIVSSLTQ